ncbi:unnamed protein product [Urochloa decumbens]|uniref:DUF4283 domain-containing protein n=1 Tax=Urochloa decumbens TaxID=240449 RepID=A0ABC9AZB7_9POAL
MLARIWVHLEGPPERIFTGYDIMRKLLLPSFLDIDVADALVRMMRNLVNETLARRPRAPGRHYVSPVWGVNIANGNSCMQSSYDTFMEPTPPYVIKRCTIVISLVCIEDAWSCYAFDLNCNNVAFMDPSCCHPVQESTVTQHMVTLKKMLPHVLYCMRRATGNKHLGRGTWTPRLLLGHGVPTKKQNTGIQALNCMRWYNKNNVCLPAIDSDASHSRMDFVYQLLSMDGNVAETNVIAESKLAELKVGNKARRGERGHGESSNSASLGSSNADEAPGRG